MRRETDGEQIETDELRMRRDRQTEHKNTENGKRDGPTGRDRRAENETRQTDRAQEYREWEERRAENS